IRVAVATGRALALACGAELVGVPTPAAIGAADVVGDPRRARRPGTAAAPGGGAEPAGPQGPAGGATPTRGPLLVVQDARRRELFVTVVTRPDDPDGVGALAPRAVPVDALTDVLPALGDRPRLAVGDAALDHADTLRAAGITVPDDPSVHRVDGLRLARIGARLAPGAADAVRPVYVRDADAIRTADR
ncbi:MAG: hypothetical protein AB7G37_11955, partial [Solirubrobacteraceae bacterium]